MTVDYNAVAAAIAARYAPAQVTPPAGLANVRVSTANLPNHLTMLPAVLVFLDAGELTPGNGTRLGEGVFLARFYLGAPKSLARDMVKLTKWLGVLVDQHGTGLQLGGLVVAVRTRGWKVGMMDYNGVTFSGIELRLQVVTSEPWTPS